MPGQSYRLTIKDMEGVSRTVELRPLRAERITLAEGFGDVPGSGHSLRIAERIPGYFNARW
jgi:hypothetical protein